MESLTVPATTAILIAIAAAVCYELRRRLTVQPSWPKIKQHKAYTQNVTLIDKTVEHGPFILDDFAPVGDRETVSDVSVFFSSRGNEFSVYSLDWEQEAVVFILTVDGTDLKRHPFFRQAQRKNAAEVLVLPFEQLQTAVDVISDMVAHVQQVFVYMTGRCGSTLLTRAIEASSVAQTANEPFAFISIQRQTTQLRRTRQSKNHTSHDSEYAPAVLLNDKTTVTLLRNVGTLLNYHLVMSDPQHRTVIFHKFAAPALFVGDLMRLAFPNAKTVFLYRNGLDVCESLARIWFKYNFAYAGIRLAVRLGLGRLPTQLFNRIFFGDDPKFSTVLLPRSPIYYLVTRWVGPMLHAVELQKSHPGYFFHAVIYYTALARGKEETIRLLMENLGIEWKGEEKEEEKRIAAAFVEDSQAGTWMSLRTSSPGEEWAPRRSSPWMSSWERDYISEVCRQAGNEISGPDFLLPNTML